MQKAAFHVVRDQNRTYHLLAILSNGCPFCQRALRCEFEALHFFVVARIPVSRDGLFKYLFVITAVPVVNS